MEEKGQGNRGLPSTVCPVARSYNVHANKASVVVTLQSLMSIEVLKEGLIHSVSLLKDLKRSTGVNQRKGSVTRSPRTLKDKAASLIKNMAKLLLYVHIDAFRCQAVFSEFNAESQRGLHRLPRSSTGTPHCAEVSNLCLFQARDVFISNDCNNASHHGPKDGSESGEPDHRRVTGHRLIEMLSGTELGFWHVWNLHAHFTRTRVCIDYHGM